MWDLDPHLTCGSLRQPESTTQTVPRLVKPFFSGLTTVTDRPTDHATQSVTTGRIHVHSTAMRPKNQPILMSSSLLDLKMDGTCDGVNFTYGPKSNSENGTIKIR